MTLDDVLHQRLADLTRQGLLRAPLTVSAVKGPRVVVEDASLLNFASNDFLGLARHPALRTAAARAMDAFGAGATASRLVCGSYQEHVDLERRLAEFKGTEAALAFSSGYMTALGTIPALVGPGDFIVLDRLAHACLVDAARLSRAQLVVFRHNDVDHLRHVLERVATRGGEASRASSHILIVTESVFSMDGDVAPLHEIVEAKDRARAWLMVDEAHATGYLGPQRSGAIEELGLTGQVEVAMGTLGKALGAAGGFIAGTRTLRDYLVQRGRSFMFSTAPPPAVVAAASAAVEVVRSDEGRTLAAMLQSRIGQLLDGVGSLGWRVHAITTPILPLIVGREDAAVELSSALRSEGMWVPAIRHPAVARGSARLRVTVSAAHSGEDVARLIEALDRAMQHTGIRPGTGEVPGTKACSS